ncbi:hypothetical protein BU17DRAFT_60429 [Hysterangium stoloniferum]|nr:hypothetical protein BU17DRAFT_60429 [Hysterangium stoloniferum]
MTVRSPTATESEPVKGRITEINCSAHSKAVRGHSKTVKGQDSMHTWNVGIWDKRCGAEGDHAPEMRVCVDGVCHILQDSRMHSQRARACLNGAAFSRMREDWRWDAGFEEYRGRTETRRDEGKGQSGK